MRLRSIPWLALALPLWLNAACSREASLTSPSGDQTGFAQAYPSELARVRTNFGEREKIARRGFESFKSFPASLRDKDADYAAVRELVRRADADGRSGYYADEALEAEAAARLLNDERGVIGRRVAGAVSYEAKQKECTVEHADELGNAGAYALQRASERQLGERRKDHSEALRYLDAQRYRVGRQNVEPLSQQVETISATSFLVFVRLELYRRELARLLDEASRVKSTLARSLEEDQALLAAASLPKARRAQLEERVAKEQAAQTAFEREIALARPAEDDFKKRLEALQKDYKAALDALDQALAARETPGSTPAPTAAPAPAAQPAPASAKPALPATTP